MHLELGVLNPTAPDYKYDSLQLAVPLDRFRPYQHNTNAVPIRQYIKQVK